MAIITTVVVTTALLTTSIGGVYLYYFRTGETLGDSDLSERLQKLQEERIKRQLAWDESKERLAKATEHHAKESSSKTIEIIDQIDKSTAALEKEAPIVHDVNLKLLSVTELLEQVSKVLGDREPLLLTELTKKVEGLTLSHEALRDVRDKLAKKAEELEKTVDRHILAQTKLKESERLDKKQIQSLKATLGEAVSKLREFEGLKDKLKSAGKIIVEQKKEITALRTQIDELEKTVRLMDSEREEADDIAKIPARKPTMFG